MLPSLVTEQVIQGIQGYLQATFPTGGGVFGEALEALLEETEGIAKGPYISLKLPFQPGSGEALPFQQVNMEFKPYLHQEEAMSRLIGSPAQSTLVATGTGSGKTECFLYPLLEYCAEAKSRGEGGVKAIVIYPMNALATDQARRFAKMIQEDQGAVGEVKVGMYVGGRSSGGDGGGQGVMSGDMVITSREEMRSSPPDILLTNYKMLDYLLVRPKDRELWRLNGPGTLKYIVVDELHTFDGAQGTDLACLLRRLKARLETPENHLCAVGTSATLGGGDAEKEMRQFAEKLFGEPFGDGSIITEKTLEPVKFLVGSKVKYGDVPDAVGLGKLADMEVGPKEEYLAESCRQWFSEDPLADESGGVFTEVHAIALGQMLKGHNTFRTLLNRMDGKALTTDELATALHSSDPDFHTMDTGQVKVALRSLLALVSAARAEAGVFPRHFLQVRFQLWLRELRRLVASVGPEPKLAFSDDLKSEDLKRHLPVVNCRDCGAMGWGGTIPNADTQVRFGLQNFYNAYFAAKTSPDLCFAFPVDPKAEGQLEIGHTLCGDCLNVADGQRHKKCPKCGRSGKLAPVSFHNHRTKDKDGKVVGSRDCPACKSKSGLMIVGSQAASLASVAINQLFSSPDNDDRKLLAFSDSVQDASHRAGFFNARTYNFSFRVALQDFIDSGGGNGLSLSEVPERFTDYWLRKLGGEGHFVANFLPADLQWLEEYQDLCDNGTLRGTRLQEILAARLRWEIISEFSFRSKVGRTLEKAGCSTAFVEPGLIEKAAARVKDSLENQVGGLKDKVEDTTVRQFLTGMLDWLRVRGGIYLPELKPFLDTGEIWQWNNRIYAGGINYLPAIGRKGRVPRFIALNTLIDHHFTGLVGARQTWHGKWLEKCFGNLVPAIQDQADTLWADILPILVDEGIFREHRGGKFQVYGLDPKGMKVASPLAKFKCSECGDSLHGHGGAGDSREGMPCFQTGCDGTYQAQASEVDFFARLFRAGKLDRVFAKEHTGLLERDKREELEKRFINGNAVAAPNLLSCTPTLEMGINIGDLSSVLLCSVPPNQANYLQRIGRAGRTDGNSFNLVFALGRPHDLFFYQEPLEMLAGNVDAPGTFLNAPAVLERQFAAYCMDQWVRDPDASVPEKVGLVLNKLDNPKGFPNNLVSFIETNAKSLLAGFLDLFREVDLDKDSRSYLDTFSLGNKEDERSLAYRITEGFHDRFAQRKALKNRIARTDKRIRDLDANPARDQNYEDTRKELVQEKSALNRIVRSIDDKEVFNLLTDEGFLPNYAFPEAGVTLRSVILKKNTGPTGPKWKSDLYEYERSASSALAEFAPANYFYAGGRKVQIDRVDLGVAKVEAWRFCPDCPRSEQDVYARDHAACPSCGSTMWVDAGQTRQMLKLTQVFATSTDYRSQSLDSEDERQTEFYQKQLLAFAEKQHITKAYKLDNESMPFGFEFLSKATFRDVNFGLAAGEEVPVAGRKVSGEGFSVCKDCGQVDTGKNDKPFKHAIDCQHRHKQTQGRTLDAIYLYRDFASEAIRILLPVAEFDLQTKLSSFMAALYLGLQLRFKGNVDHLQLTQSDEPDDTGNLRKRYLVLYDRVPGGTGYLKELMKSPGSLMELFKETLDLLQACPCGADPDKDGCYRCIYAYRVSRDMDELSRKTAIDMLSKILGLKETLVEVESLAGISLNPLFDSELELRFIKKLGEPGLWGSQVEMVPKVVKGKPGYCATVNGLQWDIELQVEVGRNEGVSEASIVDFIFWPLNQGPEVFPVAVFTDGFSYHANINGNYRVDKDLAQRNALVGSGKFHTWSLSYEDVVSEPGKPPVHRVILAGRVEASRAKLYEHAQLVGMKTIWKEGAMDSLVRYLGNPDVAKWRKVAMLEGMLLGDAKPKPLGGTGLSAYEQAVADPATNTIPAITTDPQGDRVICLQHEDIDNGEPGSLVTLYGAKASIRKLDGNGVMALVRLMDAGSTAEQDSFKKHWNGVLAAFNLFQFLPNAIVCNSRGLVPGTVYPAPDVSSPAPTAAAATPPASEMTPAWQVALEDADEPFLPLLEKVLAAGKPGPVVGYELEDAKGEVIGMAELGWEAEQVAVGTEDGEADRDSFEGAGWKFFTLDDGGQAILDALGI
jgi:DEAD/DEAH box helicase domain-containing protein